MPTNFQIIGSPAPKYLSASDILIGDMSDTNYEFLLFDRPIILLANDWLHENFGDIGIFTDLDGLESAINRSIKHPEEYAPKRKHWLKKTIHNPHQANSTAILKKIIHHAKLDGRDPKHFSFVHLNSEVLQTNLRPLFEAAKKLKLKTKFTAKLKKGKSPNHIYIGAHFGSLTFPGPGYRVHFDHGLKGQGTANVEYSKKDYIKHNYFPDINLHITAGQVGQARTEMLLGPNKNRAHIAGYPKADDFLRLNTKANRQKICQELNFDPSKPIVTYAPAGEESFMKPGGSLSDEVLKKLQQLAAKNEYNILAKLKYPKPSLIKRVHAKLGDIKRKILK